MERVLYIILIIKFERGFSGAPPPQWSHHLGQVIAYRSHPVN
jgi:hypothetical protein